MKNGTFIGDINLKSKKLNDKINGYIIKSIEKHLSKNATCFGSCFGLKIRFERYGRGKTGILINYHLMCAILAMAASINFLIDPKVVPGRAGLLVTLFLVMTGFFSDAQVILLLLLNSRKLHDLDQTL